MGEFFIELGKEFGWYDKPSQRLEGVLTTLSALVTQSSFLVIAALLTGLTIGLWLDVALRKREAKSLLINAPSNELALKAEPGRLDNIIEGLESVEDITRIFRALAKDTNQMATIMMRSQRRILSTHDYKKRRKHATALSLKLNEFSEKIATYAPQISDATKRIHLNYLAVIEKAPVTDMSDLNSLFELAEMLKNNIASSNGTVLAMDETRNSIHAINGITRELNVSAQLISATVDALQAEVKAYTAVCDSLYSVATTRAETISTAFSNPLECPSSPT
ncbi:MAG: hypothetical protein KIT85_19535 [Pseudolabrys sp.]|nr:hypothetical protein [Pseudolabrys sp.]